jgi:hypothetical protein
VDWATLPLLVPYNRLLSAILMHSVMAIRTDFAVIFVLTVSFLGTDVLGQATPNGTTGPILSPAMTRAQSPEIAPELPEGDRKSPLELPIDKIRLPPGFTIEIFNPTEFLTNAGRSLTYSVPNPGSQRIVYVGSDVAEPDGRVSPGGPG